MTPTVLLLRGTATVRMAAEILGDTGVDAAPVTDGQTVIGVTTPRELARLTGHSPDLPLRATFADRAPQVVVPTDESSLRTGDLLDRAGQRYAVVTRHGAVVGLVDLVRIARALPPLSLLRPRPPATP